MDNWRFIFIVMVFIFVGSFVSGATYYVDDDAIDNSGDGLTPTTSKHNIQAALSLANDLGGDTIIILDGIYDELEDRITQSYLPSSANTYTTIKAQNRWGVEIKQSLDCSNDWSSRNYIHLDGLKFTNLAYHRFNGANWKITNCAFYGTLGMGNNGCFQNGFNCEDILIEDTHVWGPGGVDSMRYKVLVYNNKRVILRRVVARHDGGYTTTLSNPSAVFIIYSSQSVRLQNTIAIDSPGQVNDRWNAGYYTADHQYSGQLSWTDVKWEGSIAMNIKDTISFRIDNTHDSDGVDTVYDNCVALAGSGGSTFAAYCSSNCINSDSVIYNQCNAIDSGTTVTNDAFWESRYNSTVQYSIMLNQSGDAISYIDYTNYNNAYGCNNNNPGTNGFTIDPKQSGLLYPVRIESGSSLETVGNGQRVGANIIYRWGGTGIMWGEPGFNEISTESLWPWSNEDQIKQDFQLLSGNSNGSRGFAADGNGLYRGPITLTSYIWEYLGNECPPEICNYNIQNCTDAGGTCQTNSCDNYQNCSSLIGTCSSGNCCSGSCTEIGCVDSDGDGYNVSQSGCGTADCNDSNSLIYPGAIEICGNGIDEDCDGSDLSCNDSLTISDITATPSTTSVTINWITDEAATSIVEYGLTASYSDSVEVLSLVFSHLVSLTGLESGTLYHYRVLSNDSMGDEAVSGDGVFTTTVETGGDDSGTSDGGSSGGGSSGGGSSSTECVLTNAYWSVVSAREGEEVLLTVEGEDCEGEGIDLFVIWEDDLIGDDSVDVNPSTVDFLDGKAVASWTVEYQDDFFGEPEYYFVSSLKSDAEMKIDSRDYCDLLRVVEAGGFVREGCPDYVWTGIR